MPHTPMTDEEIQQEHRELVKAIDQCIHNTTLNKVAMWTLDNSDKIPSPEEYKRRHEALAAPFVTLVAPFLSGRSYE